MTDPRHELNGAGYLHCEDGPAFVNDRGDEEWYFNGHLHREDGPAFTTKGGLGWFIAGIHQTSNALFQRASGISDEEMLVLILKYGDIT